MQDPELIAIVQKAIPLRSCHLNRANDVAMRVWLMQQIERYVSNQLSKQFNAKPVND